jgi:hypothetical protein
MEQGDILQERILREVEQGTNKDALISDLIFAGFSYDNISAVLESMVAQGKIPPEYWQRTGYAPIPKGPQAHTLDETFASPPKKPSWIARHTTLVIVVAVILLLVGVGIGVGWWTYRTNASVLLHDALRAAVTADSVSFSIESTGSFSPALAGDEFIENVLSATSDYRTSIEGTWMWSGASAALAAGISWYDADDTLYWNANTILPVGVEQYAKVGDVWVSQGTLWAEVYGDIAYQWTAFSSKEQPSSVAYLGPRGFFKTTRVLSAMTLQDRDMLHTLISAEDIFVGAIQQQNQEPDVVSISFTIQPSYAEDISAFIKRVSGVDVSASLIKDASWKVWVNTSQRTLRAMEIAMNQGSGVLIPDSIVIFFDRWNQGGVISAPDQVIPLSQLELRIQRAVERYEQLTEQ